MLSCCAGGPDLCKDFSCKVEETEKGLTITISGDDPKKVEALKKFYAASRELCCDDNSCCS